MAFSKEFEFKSAKRLDDIRGSYFSMPAGIIFDNGNETKLTASFSFFAVSRGLNYKAMFSLNGMVEWSGKKPTRNVGGTNHKFSCAINKLEDMGYISLNGKASNVACCTADINMEKIRRECDEDGYALIWVDELDKILHWENKDCKDSFVNADVLLKVFAYLRMMIPRRPNKMHGWEINVDNKNDPNLDIESRRMRMPEAYSAYYCDIAEDLDMSERVVSKSIDCLEDMGLMHSEALPRIKVNGKWNTNQTVFCNAYKREGRYLLANGKEYWRKEIECKKRILKSMGGR